MNSILTVMRTVFISVASAMLALICLILLTDLGVKEPIESTQTASLLREVRGNSKSLSTLQLELEELHNLYANSNAIVKSSGLIADEKIDYSEITERLESMEGALLEITSIERRDGELEKQFSEMLQTTNHEASANQFTDAEEYFNNDSGRPIGTYADSIEQNLSTVKDLDVAGMDCGESICKVTYSRPDSSRFIDETDVESKLADKLLFGIDAQDVDLRYADDPYGNRVVYIQLH